MGLTVDWWTSSFVQFSYRTFHNKISVDIIQWGTHREKKSTLIENVNERREKQKLNRNDCCQYKLLLRWNWWEDWIVPTSDCARPTKSMTIVCARSRQSHIKWTTTTTTTKYHIEEYKTSWSCWNKKKKLENDRT